MSNLRGRSRKVVTKDLDSESRANFFKSVNLLTRIRDTKMSNLREEFEKLPEIKRRLEFCYWSDTDGCYRSNVGKELSIYLNGALYAFQEQQKKIDAARKEVNNFFDNQTITPSPREYANKLADVLELLK